MLLFLHIADHFLRTKIAAASDSVVLFRHSFGFIVPAFGIKA